MRVIVAEHALKRLRESRQEGITLNDIITAAESVPGMVASATRFRSFVARSGRKFDIVVRDISGGRLVITVIGK